MIEGVVDCRWCDPDPGGVSERVVEVDVGREEDQERERRGDEVMVACGGEGRG